MGPATRPRIPHHLPRRRQRPTDQGRAGQVVLQGRRRHREEAPRSHRQLFQGRRPGGWLL